MADFVILSQVSMNKLLLSIGTSVLLLLGIISPAFAQDTKMHPSGDATGLARSCEARESAIKNRSTHLTELAANVEIKFDKIAMSTETFYTDKVVPSGKTLSNYQDLVNDISAKKALVTTALNKAQADASSFSCASGTPKAQMTQFRLDMQNTKNALKDYRTSIRNLIVAVRSLRPSMTPKP